MTTPTDRGAGAARPSLRVERSLARAGYPLVAGMDEVGRGALAGPVTVGVVVVAATTRSAPRGIADSKLLPPPRREALVGPVRRWAHAWGVGHAAAEEIDAYGILAALRIAGCRALAAAGLTPDVVLLDGGHDWLTRPAGPLPAPAGAAVQADLGLDVGLDGGSHPGLGAGALGGRRPPPDLGPTPVVRTLVKADRTCSSVAAASILAKVERDAIMTELAVDHPAYGWDGNKGYAAPDHRRAIAVHGPSTLHRRTWRLGGRAPVGRGAPGVGAMGHDGSVKVRVP